MWLNIVSEKMLIYRVIPDSLQVTPKHITISHCNTRNYSLTAILYNPLIECRNHWFTKWWNKKRDITKCVVFWSSILKIRAIRYGWRKMSLIAQKCFFNEMHGWATTDDKVFYWSWKLIWRNFPYLNLKFVAYFKWLYKSWREIPTR